MMKVSIDHLPITWTADAISKEFGIPQATLYRRLKAADIDLKGEISTRDALRAVFKEGTYTAERLRLARAQADKCEIEVAQLRGEYVERSYVTSQFKAIFQLWDELFRSFAPAAEYVRRWREIVTAKTGIPYMVDEDALKEPRPTDSHPDAGVRYSEDPSLVYIHDGEVNEFEKAHLAWLQEHRPELLKTYPERKKAARAEYIQTVLDSRNRIISADGSCKYEPLDPEVVAHLRAYLDGPTPEELQ